MNRPLLYLSLLLAWLGAVAAAAAADSAPTPAGVWRVIGDKSGEAEALVEISEQSGVFAGRITRVFARPGVEPKALCELCPGARRNQPVEGLTILTGLRRQGDEFAGGEILDPDTGDLYRASMRLGADKRTLYVRGYIGIPLLGRTQTWLRE